MKKNKIIIVFVLIFFIFLSVKEINAYGFGVKKNNENKEER